MKRVVSVSLGSKTRDHKAEVEVLGERFVLERVGTDGDFQKAIALIQELDGQVDAIGLGGIDLYLYAAGRRYTIRDALKLARAAKKTPVVDGSGLKATLERRAVYRLNDRLGFRGKKVLIPSAVDRFGMAEAFYNVGAKTLYGDFIFALGLPIPLSTPAQLAVLARVFLPFFTKLPFTWLYPTGKKQEETKVDWRSRYFHWADVIAGDFLYVRRHMPEGMTGKGVVSNTTTQKDLEFLRQRGVAWLATTTPRLGGRSFGTNVMEAMIVALAGRYPLTPEDYAQWVEKLGLEPELIELRGPGKINDKEETA